MIFFERLVDRTLRITIYFLLFLGNSAMAVNPDKVFERDMDRNLARAAAKGDITNIQEMLAKGVAVTGVGRGGFTLTHFALYADTPDVLNLLLKAGADPVSRLANNSTVPHHAVQMANSAFLKTLLQAKIDPNLKGEDDKPLLILAAMARQIDNLKLLAAAGADMNVTWAGKSALHFALQIPNIPMATQLLILGTSPLQRDRFGDTAMDNFCRFTNGNLMRTIRLEQEFEQFTDRLVSKGVDMPCKLYENYKKK